LRRLAIITTHPIQYNAPLFAELGKSREIVVKVFYTWGKEVLDNKYDPGFEKVINWDIPLLEGYEYCFVQNIAADKGSHHFNGIINPGLDQEILAWGANCILVFGWSFKSHLAILKGFHGKIPILFRGDSTLIDKISLWKYWVRKYFLKTVYKNVNLALYTGSNNRKYFLWAGLKETQLQFAPHVVDNSRFNKPLDSKELRENYQLPQNQFLFLFAGKLEEKKDPLLLLSCFQELQQGDCSLVFVGDGKLLSTLKETVLPGSAVYFIPFQNQGDMPGVYQMADCLVLPSKGPGETWGLAINEAMASGIPVIASDKCGGTADLIQEGVTGYTFSAENANELKGAMLKMIEKKRERHNWKPALEEKMSNYSLPVLVSAIEQAVLKYSKE
jgi:glycosyltransferase involved in cell wall biosynthesis